MTSVIANVLIGLATSLISGTSVWLWQRARASAVSRRRRDFFGAGPGQSCVVVMGHHHHSPRRISRLDVRALLEVGALAYELGAEVAFEEATEMLGSNRDRTEFCVGGPNANERSAGHLAHHLPGVTFRPYSGEPDPDRDPDSLAIAVGDHTFRWVRDELEHAVVAKFTPHDASSPVFLVCGHTPNANRAGVFFLRQHHQELTRTLPPDRFCVILRITAPRVYGHESVAVERDVTAEAFAAPA
jgi:hypothetical protein